MEGLKETLKALTDCYNKGLCTGSELRRLAKEVTPRQRTFKVYIKSQTDAHDYVNWCEASNKKEAIKRFLEDERLEDFDSTLLENYVSE